MLRIRNNHIKEVLRLAKKAGPIQTDRIKKLVESDFSTGNLGTSSRKPSSKPCVQVTRGTSSNRRNVRSSQWGGLFVAHGKLSWNHRGTSLEGRALKSEEISLWPAGTVFSSQQKNFLKQTGRAFISLRDYFSVKRANRALKSIPLRQTGGPWGISSRNRRALTLPD